RIPVLELPNPGATVPTPNSATCSAPDNGGAVTRRGTPEPGFLALGAHAYRGYLLVILAVFLGLSVVDRLALGLLLQNIKQSLHLSDTQLGVLTGIAFAVFYAFAGLLIGRWADRGNRITIIATTAALWSVLVGLCGA